MQNKPACFLTYQNCEFDEYIQLFDNRNESYYTLNRIIFNANCIKLYQYLRINYIQKCNFYLPRFSTILL